jgi:ATPase subunit of ABC transporter with duplicated ATPase domains
MIAATDLSMSYGAHTLFRGANLQLNPGNRYGLVGANGSGKTTLLRLLSGREESTEGSVSRPKRLRLGVLEQDHFQYEDARIIDVAMMGHAELWRALQEKDDLLDLSDSVFDGERYGELEDIIVSHEGYAYEARCGEILEGLGIPTEKHSQPLSTLSGGFKLRVLLAQVLASDPTLLLLDEPTNHLDILSIRWLEKFLVEYQGCAVVISHDHRFLDNVCSHILDIDYQTVTTYVGNYASFVTAKEAERQRREAEIAKREKQIADHQAFVDRFRAKATKARQAQSKVKLIERTVIESLPQSSRRYPRFRFRQRRPSGKSVLELEGISKSVGNNVVLVDVGLHVRRGDRLAIIGPNGIGKSTLLKIAMGHLAPDSGTVTWGHETAPGYFAQDHRDQLGGSEATVEAWLAAACPGEATGFVRGRLGNVLFERDDVTKKVANLSGGEAARLLFARLGVEQPNVLVLDEPTNHLDLEAIEALVTALEEYDGTLILVSHDRWFVSRLATRVLEITARGTNDYRGSYDEYVASCGDDHLDAEATNLRQRRDKRRRRRQPLPEQPPDRLTSRRRKDLELRRDVITAGMDEAETRIEQINRDFCEPGFFDTTPPDRIRALQREQKQLSGKVEEFLAEWERIEAELESGGG